MMEELFSPGTKVFLGSDRKIEATITAICIRGRNKEVTYEIVWWSDRERKCQWVCDFELYQKPNQYYKTKVGFK